MILQAHNPANRMNICNWILQSVHDGDINPNMIFFSNMTLFHLHGEVSLHISRLLEFTQSETNTQLSLA
jgi:hypothetical protein